MKASEEPDISLHHNHLATSKARTKVLEFVFPSQRSKASRCQRRRRRGAGRIPRLPAGADIGHIVSQGEIRPSRVFQLQVLVGRFLWLWACCEQITKMPYGAHSSSHIISKKLYHRNPHSIEETAIFDHTGIFLVMIFFPFLGHSCV